MDAKVIMIILFLGTMHAIESSVDEPEFRWPDDKKAAVCMTFDDGLDCHLDVAVPLLDSFNFKGTFYCTGNSSSLHNRLNEWRAIAKTGHEIGNHSLFHPCDGNRLDWVKPEYDLNTYTMERLRSELYTANTLLQAVDNHEERTFGYTCSDYRIGDNIEFVDLVRELFPAARNEGPIPDSMANIDPHFMPSWFVIENSGKELIDYVVQAKQKGTVAIFMFHSVGGGYLNVSTEALRELLAFLQANQKDYWVDTFYNVTRYISDTRQAE